MVGGEYNQRHIRGSDYPKKRQLQRRKAGHLLARYQLFLEKVDSQCQRSSRLRQPQRRYFCQPQQAQQGHPPIIQQPIQGSLLDLQQHLAELLRVQRSLHKPRPLFLRQIKQKTKDNLTLPAKSILKALPILQEVRLQPTDPAMLLLRPLTKRLIAELVQVLRFVLPGQGRQSLRGVPLQDAKIRMKNIIRRPYSCCSCSTRKITTPS